MRPKGLQVTEYPIRAEQGARRRNTWPPRGYPRTYRDRHLVVVQDEGGVDAGELGDRSHVVDCRHGASRRMK